MFRIGASHWKLIEIDINNKINIHGLFFSDKEFLLFQIRILCTNVKIIIEYLAKKFLFTFFIIFLFTFYMGTPFDTHEYLKSTFAININLKFIQTLILLTQKQHKVQFSINEKKLRQLKVINNIWIYLK